MTTDAIDTAGDGELLATWLGRTVEVALRVMEANRECLLSGGVADGEWQDTTFGDELWAASRLSPRIFAQRSRCAPRLTMHWLRLVVLRPARSRRSRSRARSSRRRPYPCFCPIRRLSTPSGADERSTSTFRHLAKKRALAEGGQSAEAAVNARKADRILAAADGFGWGQARPTLPPDYRRVAAIGNPRPRIMTLIDHLLSTANTPGFGSQQYRAVSAIAHAAPHAIGLVGDGSDPLTARDIAQRHLPMLGAFGLATLILCHRMGWDNHVLRVVYDKTLRLWLEAAEPGSSAGLIDVF